MARTNKHIKSRWLDYNGEYPKSKLKSEMTSHPPGIIEMAEAGKPVLAGPLTDATKTLASELWGLLVLGPGKIPAMVIRIIKTGGYVIEAVGVVIESPSTWKIGEKVRTAAQMAAIVRDIKKMLFKDKTVLKVITRGTRATVRASGLISSGKKPPAGGGFGVFARANLYRPVKPTWMTQNQYQKYLREKWIPYGEHPKKAGDSNTSKSVKMDYSKMSSIEYEMLVSAQAELYVELQKKGIIKVRCLGMVKDDEFPVPSSTNPVFCHKGIAYPIANYFLHKKTVYKKDRYYLWNGYVMDKKAKGILM